MHDTVTHPARFVHKTHRPEIDNVPTPRALDKGVCILSARVRVGATRTDY